MPSGFICAFKVISMCTVFGSTVRAVVLLVHTSSQDFFQSGPLKSSPSIGARSIMPSMNSSGMPRSVRVGVLSARRPYHENAILTATSGRVAATSPAGICVRRRWPSQRGRDPGQQGVDELPRPDRVIDVQRDEAAFRKAQLSVGTEYVALNVREVEHDGHGESQIPMTPGAWVGAPISLGLLVATNVAKSS